MSREGLQFTRIEAAALCDLSPRQFDEAVRPLIRNGENGAGKSLRFDGPAIVKAIVEYRLAQSKPTADDGDPLLTGANSPALERYRLVKAKLAERDLEERDRSLVRLSVLRDAIRPAVAAMRGAGERLTRLFGNEAGDIYNEAIEEFEQEATKVLVGTNGGGNG